MKRTLIAFGVSLGLAALPAVAQGPDDGPPGKGNGPQAHDMKHPLGKKQFGWRQEGLKAKAKGQASGRSHQVAKGQFVELEQTRNDRIFVVIAEFGTAISSLGGTPGPLHNQIAQPNRAVDNATIWQSDYDKGHFEDMYFNRMKEYYRSQSSGRYSIDGSVTD